MTVVGLVLVTLAAAVHIVVFVLESARWMHPETRAVFGIATEEEARATRLLAFNQGFYNLFLAVVALTGVALIASGAGAAGSALAIASAGSMVGAGVVLIVSSPNLLRAALVQLLPPGLGLLALAAGALL
jgi:putative membrane protein